MFTWICPTCGQEVPPSASECPACASAQARRAESAAGAPPRAEPSYTPRPAAPAPAPRTPGAPGWILTLVFAILFLCMGTLGFLAYRYFAHRGEPLDLGPAQPVRTPRTSGPDSATPTANVLNKYIEVTGLRLLEDSPKNLQVAFVIVNHSQAPLTDLAGIVTIRPTNAPPDGEAVGTFAFQLPELAPLGVKDMKAPLQSKLRVYELPDWQFIRADVTITSPQPTP
jgi:hypothetical protein